MVKSTSDKLIIYIYKSLCEFEDQIILDLQNNIFLFLMQFFINQIVCQDQKSQEPMSSPNKQAQQSIPDPLNSTPVEAQNQWGYQNPVYEGFPSTNQFGEPLNRNPSMASMASINYGEQQNNKRQQKNMQEENQLVAQFNDNTYKQPQQEFQKVNMEKNQIDQDQILRMFRQEDERKEKHQRQAAQLRKKNSQTGALNMQKDKKSTSHAMTKKQTTHEDYQKLRQQRDQNNPLGLARFSSNRQIKQMTGHTSLKLQKIRQLVTQYKIQYRSSLFDQQWQKERYRLKEQLFEQLCIGIEQIKLKGQNQLTTAENAVLQKISQINEHSPQLNYNFGIFKLCRNLVMQIDFQIFIHFHQKSKQPLSKDYKSQYKLFLTNMKDPENYQLRIKVLTGEMDSQSIKIANEMEFFTEAKRQQIKEKERKLLKEFSADREHIMLKPQFQQQKQDRLLSQNIKYDSSVLNQRKPSAIQSHFLSSHTFQDGQSVAEQGQFSQKKTLNSLASLISMNKYLQESTLSQLDQLLSDGQILKMRKRLEQDLRGIIKQKLLKRFDRQN